LQDRYTAPLTPVTQRRVGAATLILALLVPASAHACPSCPTSKLVSAVICNEDFWKHVAAVMAPFPVFGLLSAFLYRFGRPAPKRSQA
jgi:hypothetical protein